MKKSERHTHWCLFCAVSLRERDVPDHMLEPTHQARQRRAEYIRNVQLAISRVEPVHH